MDNRDYMGLSLMVRLCKWSLLGLTSYNLGGSFTDLALNFFVTDVSLWGVCSFP